MIISKTPFRISFFGGGTDYPAWYLEHGGSVLATAINKYCYISVRTLPPFFDYKHRIVYSKTELINDIDDIQHPVVRAVLCDADPKLGLEIHHAADLPARSGLGSSSSFTVGILNSMQALDGNMVSDEELARGAIHIEQEVLQEAVGCQDQITVSFGGFNRIDFRQDGTFAVTPIIMSAGRRSELEQSTMLFFSGFSRYASDVAKKQIANFPNRMQQLSSMRGMVDEGMSILLDNNRPIEDLGKLLNEAWSMKKTLAEGVTTPDIDEIYEAAMEAGASGGKLLGAGGGGFIAFIVRTEFRNKVRERLSNLIHVDFKFETDGSRIVIYEPQGLGNSR